MFERLFPDRDARGCMSAFDTLTCASERFASRRARRTTRGPEAESLALRSNKEAACGNDLLAGRDNVEYG